MSAIFAAAGPLVVMCCAKPTGIDYIKCNEEAAKVAEKHADNC